MKLYQIINQPAKRFPRFVNTFWEKKIIVNNNMMVNVDKYKQLKNNKLEIQDICDITNYEDEIKKNYGHSAYKDYKISRIMGRSFLRTISLTCVLFTLLHPISNDVLINTVYTVTWYSLVRYTYIIHNYDDLMSSRYKIENVVTNMSKDNCID